MTLENCKAYYKVFVEQGRTTEAEQLRENTLKFRGIDLAEKEKVEKPEETKEKSKKTKN